MIIHVPKSSLDLTNAKVLQVTENSKDFYTVSYTHLRAHET